MSKLFSFRYTIFNYRIVRFLFSGGLATATDLVLLFIFVNWYGLNYLPSSVLAFVAGMSVSFLMQKFFTFKDYSRDRIHKQTAFYFGFHILNLCLNTLLMYVCVTLLNVPYLIAQILIAGGLAICNFFTSKHLVFIPDATYNKITK